MLVDSLCLLEVGVLLRHHLVFEASCACTEVEGDIAVAVRDANDAALLESRGAALKVVTSGCAVS